MKWWGLALIVAGLPLWLAGMWLCGLFALVVSAPWADVFTLQTHAVTARLLVSSWWGAAVVVGAGLMMWGGYLVKRAR